MTVVNVLKLTRWRLTPQMPVKNLVASVVVRQGLDHCSSLQIASKSLSNPGGPGLLLPLLTVSVFTPIKRNVRGMSAFAFPCDSPSSRHPLHAMYPYNPLNRHIPLANKLPLPSLMSMRVGPSSQLLQPWPVACENARCLRLRLRDCRHSRCVPAVAQYMKASNAHCLFHSRYISLDIPIRMRPYISSHP